MCRCLEKLGQVERRKRSGADSFSELLNLLILSLVLLICFCCLLPASTKRSHECWATSAASVIGGEQILRQASTSPVQAGAAGMLSSPSPAPPSPSSSNASMRKKMVSHLVFVSFVLVLISVLVLEV